MQEDSMVDAGSISGHPFGMSPSSANPFEKANKDFLKKGRAAKGAAKHGGDLAGKGDTSIKSQSLFSNYYSGKHTLETHALRLPSV